MALFRAWSGRYMEVMAQFRPTKPIRKPPQMKNDVWTFISNLARQRKSLSQTYEVESIRVLERYSAIASSSALTDADNLHQLQHGTPISTIDDSDTQHSTDDESGMADDPTYDFDGNTFISNAYYLSFKKFKGIKFNQHDRLYLEKAASTTSFDSGLHSSIYNIVLHLLRKVYLNNDEISLLKLSLSNAINFLNPGAVNLVKTFMDDGARSLFEQQTKAAITQFDCGLSEQCSSLYDELMEKTLMTSPNDAKLLQAIYQKKADLVTTMHRTDEQFCLLSILEHV
ncbi:uncharacterized protein BX664DRAFT_41810 [Halteromyces radiatus]|uniref:uncharacterized protein n=1 Tax=Halteromyces radiatus TaxID=101107 RepID=UPI00222001B3|nr:uncharacterized protein BX664DRAFT_41810 [Halteromyces radiatus]KAI8077677.1 hypothetical protein BX664DRAFT_41810 [Halteromyces radiatus]